ncbi:replicative DNA helicase [Leptolyngbya sp. PCC 7375]|nr:replicative DNA helicase [Leptolyngbya sp. PCC 7375]
MLHSRFTLNKRSNPCPICESSDGRCKSSPEGIQLCMGALTKQDIPGYGFRGKTKNGVWGLWVEVQSFADPAEYQAWRTELERKKLQRYMAEQQEREAALSTEERHDGYISVFSQLDLEDCDRNDLLSRGFTEKQIAEIGFRSVGQWQKLSSPVNPKLPGASPEGDRLNIPYPGYLCFARDAEGRICGAQVRSRDNEGPRYYWLTSRTRKNVHGSTPHMPSGELPLSVYWPEEVISNQVVFVEGVGPKPALAAFRLGCPVIGAAGAQWGASPSELRSALGVVLSRLEGAVDYVLYPDGGMLDARHEGVRDRYRDLAACLGSDMKVAWWGQTAYGQDIDEVPQDVQIGVIGWAEFEAMADGDGEIPQEVLLEVEVSKYNQLFERPYAQTLQENKIGTEFGVRGKRLQSLANFANNGVNGAGASIAEVGCELFTEIEERSLNEAPLGISTGFADLDEMLGGGFQDGDLIVPIGRAAMGKTAWTLNVAKNIAESGVEVVFFSLEMDKKRLSYRILSLLSGISSQRLRAGKVSTHEWESLGHATSKLTGLPIHLFDVSDLGGAPTTESLKECLDTISVEPKVIFIDYLQLMGSTLRDDTSEATKLGQVSRGLKFIAGERKVPVVALAQVNRGVEARSGKRPMMSDIRSSGSIEQDADIVLGLYRDDYYNSDSPDKGITELIFLKHRDGPTGTVKLLFEPEYTRFRSLVA